MKTDEKPNVVQLTYKEIFKINPLSTQFSCEENKRVIMNPAYRRLLLEIRPTDMKGPYEIVTYLHLNHQHQILSKSSRLHHLQLRFSLMI